MMARSSNAPSTGRIQKRKTNLSKSSLSACNARPVHTEGPIADVDPPSVPQFAGLVPTTLYAARGRLEQDDRLVQEVRRVELIGRR